MKITQLYVYPVKSLAGIAVTHLDLDCLGPEWDRRWMIVDNQGKFLTQRQLPQMALVTTALKPQGIELQAPGFDPLSVNLEDFSQGELIPVQVWRDTCLARLGTAAMHAWLSQALNTECRLVFMPDDTERLADSAYAGEGVRLGFADGFPLLLTNETSLQQFNRWMSLDISMNRFRPNLVIDGESAWQEDQWQRITIGSLVFDVVKPCSRCAIPTIDPSTGEKQPEVFKTLKQYRSRDGMVFFGQNLVARQVGRLSLGDSVLVLS